MKIAFVHYHLKPGGVTTVIRQQMDALKNRCEVLAITGEAPEKDFPFTTIVIPEIGYDHPDRKWPAPEKTARKIIAAISKHWPSGCDILHVHNPLLAKNKNFLTILKSIQHQNIRMLLQIHDFAEDGRPQLFYANDSYPADCHYSVINSRDYLALSLSGLKSSGLHLIMNMVTPFNLSPVPNAKITRDFILYPVRAIRRKNIGEAMLISLFFPENRFLAITLPPNSDRDWKYYKEWKAFAARYHLNVLFEISKTHPFKDLVQTAAGMITTSISEGFGFSYLEPWTAGQMINGRILPDICDDFKQKGILLDHMYEKVAVPTDWINLSAFYAKWTTCIRENAALYNIHMPEKKIQEAFTPIQKRQTIDFAVLDEPLQQQVIRKILFRRDCKSRFLSLNPFLEQQMESSHHQQRILHNRRIVESRFGRSRYQDQLIRTYQNVLGQTVTHSINKQRLAEFFLNPETFSLLKWSSTSV